MYRGRTANAAATVELTLKQLAYASAAAEHGSFSEAARRLEVSQASVSAAISELERYIGARLFERHSSRGIDLTPEGESFVRGARALLLHAKRFEDEVSRLDEERAGKLKVGCESPLATRFLPGIASGFAVRRPEVRLSLREIAEDENTSELLLTEKIDFGVGLAQPEDPRILSEELISLPPFALVEADHPLALRRSVALRELVSAPFWQVGASAAPNHERLLFAPVGAEPAVVMNPSSPEFVRCMVARGLGFAIQNILPSIRLTHEGRGFAALAIDDPLPSLHVMAFWLAEGASGELVQAFGAYVREYFAAERAQQAAATTATSPASTLA